MNRLWSRAGLFLVVAASLALLVARSRPLARMSGTVEPLLFATGLSEPRGLASQPDGTLLVTQAGGGLARIDEAGTVTTAGGARASLLATALAWPDAGPADARLPTGGTAWAAAADARGAVYATLPLSNQLIRLSSGGTGGASGSGGLTTAQPVTGFLGADGRNPLPTGLTVGPDGALYVTLFAAEGTRATGGKVVRVEADGRWQPILEGLTYPTGLAFGAGGQLYVLELARGFDERGQRYTPGSGRLLALGPAPNRRRTVVREISYPTGITIAPLGDVFFTENGLAGFGGAGHVLRVPAAGLTAGG